jgi:hypothetical protein
VAVAQEEADVDGGGGGRQSREQWRLREFEMKSEMTRGGLLFIGSKILAAVLN